MLALAGKLWNRAKSLYARLTLTRAGVLFILLTCMQCLVLVGIKIVLYYGDSGASSLLSGIIQKAEVPLYQLPRLLQHDGNLELQLCNHIPIGPSGEQSCTTVFNTATPNAVNLTHAARDAFSFSRHVDYSQLTRRTLSISKITTYTNGSGDVDGVLMTYTDDAHNETVFLGEQCARVLVYSQQTMTNYAYEDIALLGAQFWLLIVSIVAISLCSIPQIIAVSLTRVLATMWAAYSIWHTLHYEDVFNRLMVAPGTPCQFNFFPTLFRTRMCLASADLVLNLAGLVFTLVLGRKLMKKFNTFTFQRVGPPLEILRIYRLFLGLFVCLQLSLFFTVTAIGLWITYLMQGLIRYHTSGHALYDGVFIATITTLPFWIAMGWFAVRRENRMLIFLFLVLCFLYIASWSFMFWSQVYRFTFLEWVFFSSTTVVSFIVLISAGVFAILCWLNFDKGLAHYLHVESVLEESNFAPELFANQPASRMTRISSEGASSTTTTLKRDINWDPFHSDDTRPAVIVIDWHDRSPANKA